VRIAEYFWDYENEVLGMGGWLCEEEWRSVRKFCFDNLKMRCYLEDFRAGIKVCVFGCELN
jgi:hypothetical protein